jgi:hypothetical protein
MAQPASVSPRAPPSPFAAAAAAPVPPPGDAPLHGAGCGRDQDALGARAPEPPLPLLFHDACCGVSRSSLDSTSSLVSTGTEDGSRRPAGILRRAGSWAPPPAPAAPPLPRRVRFSDNGAAPATAAAAVAAAAARPAAGGALQLPSTSPAAEAPAGSAFACPVAQHALAVAPPRLAAAAAAVSPAAPPAAQQLTRSYTRGRFAVQEGPLLLGSHSFDGLPLAGSAEWPARALHMGRSTSLPDTSSLALALQGAAAAAAAAARRGGAGSAAGHPAASARSCPDLPRLSEEAPFGAAPGGGFGDAACFADGSACSDSMSWGAVSAPSVLGEVPCAVGEAEALLGPAPPLPPAAVPHPASCGAAAVRMRGGPGAASALAAAVGGGAPQRRQTVCYFRRGRFLVSSATPGR